MSRVLAESVNQLYSVMMQLKEKTPKKDLTKIADSLEEFFHASLLKAVEEVEETSALRVLLQLKLDPNVRYHSTHGKVGTKATPLYIACQLGNTETVRLLLQYQADPNIPSTDNKKTPLMVACSNKHTEVVKLLLAHKATDVEALDGDQDTALRYANDRNSTEVARLLLETAHANPNVYGKNDWSCLLVSCCDGYLDNVALLLEHKADPYHRVKGGKTCLMLAGQNGHVEIVRLLLNSKRVDVKRLINQQTEEGWTTLALSYTNPKIVELLLEHGADPNLPTNDGWTPLILACQKEGHPTTVELLLNPKYQVEIEHANKYGVSAYSLASLFMQKGILELLDKAGAKKRGIVGDVAKSMILRLPVPVQSLIRKFGSNTVTSEGERTPHGDSTISSCRITSTAIGDGMSTGATGVISPPHHQPSTVTAPVNTQQQLPADNVPILTNPSSSTSSSTDPSSFAASSSSSTNQLILSVEELILALPSIADPVGFGLCLGVGYSRCEQLIKVCGQNALAQVRAIAAEWYSQSPHPTWNKVVEALYKHGLVRDAVNLASKVGVRSPCQEDGDSDHY